MDLAPLEPDPRVDEPLQASGRLSWERFLALYEAVAGSLLAWATLRIPPSVRGVVDPDDVLQEIACRAVDGFESLPEQETSFRAWIFGIGRNVLRESFRRAARSRIQGTSHGDRAPAPTLSQIPAEITNISRRAGRREEFDRLLRRIETLDEEERQLVLHHGLEGMSLPAVAEILGTSADAAKKRWQRIRARLQVAG